MPKPRVYEVASEYGVSTAVILEKLATLGDSASGQFSPLQPDVARKLRAALEADALGQVEAVRRGSRRRKPRVHEVADELGIDSRAALAKLRELGEFVRSSSSTIQPPVARKLRAAFEADRSAGSAAQEGSSDPDAPSSDGSEARPLTPSAIPPRARPAKPRVHEVASELGLDSKLALARLKELGEYVKSPSATLEPPVARKLRAALEADVATRLGGSDAVAEQEPPLEGDTLTEQDAQSPRSGPRPRVHEVASELGVDVDIVFAKLRELGEPARSTVSALDPSLAMRVRAAVRG